METPVYILVIFIRVLQDENELAGLCMSLCLRQER